MIEFPKPVHKKRSKPRNTRAKGTICLVNTPGCIGPIDRAHIRSKGAGGGNEDWNQVDLCRGHHQSQHTFGFDWMFRAFPHFWDHLRSMGWEWDRKTGKTWHPNLARGEC